MLQSGAEGSEGEKITKNPFADHVPSFQPVDLTGYLILITKNSTGPCAIFRAARGGPSVAEHSLAGDTKTVRTWLRNILRCSQSRRTLRCLSLQGI